MTALLLLLTLAADDKPFDGHLQLFDGETTFGWRIDGEVKVEKGKLILGGGKATRAEFGTVFGEAGLALAFSYEGPVTVIRGGRKGLRYEGRGEASGGGPIEAGSVPVAFDIPAGSRVVLASARLKPAAREMTPLFDGKSLAGWKAFKGDAKREKSKFSVKGGELHVKDGPGDLATEKLLDDFVLQAECRVNGKGLNSGIFFRCIPGEYQNGYEAQIHNDFTLSPAKKYLVDVFDKETGKKTGTREVVSAAKDFGTGAIYRRVPARKGMAKDGEWFTLTVAARGRHIATWVNGVQQVDWTDERPADDNPRKGYRAKAGAISIQGHDPTTDLSFRDLRYVEIPRVKE